MGLKFAANLNFLFTEGAPTLLEKMHRARQAGFRAVEIPYPHTNDEGSLPSAKEEIGIEVALMNIALGSKDLAFGSACIPGAEEVFKKQLHETINLANTLNCKKIHIMSGLRLPNGTYDDYLKTYIENLTYATNCLQKANIVGVIEPINKYALPEYFMNNYDTAIQVIKNVNSQNLKVMVDVFHLQHICGNVTNTFKELQSIIGHIQIAQVPHRNEPDIDGELDFSYIFNLIEESGYTDWIGCEYKPKTTTTDGLSWLNKYGLKL